MKKKKPKSGGTHRISSSESNHRHHHHHHHGKNKKKVAIKNYEELPNRYRSNIDPLNLEEQKLQFLKHGQTPHFQFKVSAEKIEEISHTKRAEIEFDHLDEAVAILEKVRGKYGTGNLCVEQMYGERITTERASHKLSRYLQQNGADGAVAVGWTKDQACSAKMAWCGPSMRHNHPEKRKFSLFLQDSTENQFLRDRGILCLADHEIGTHFLRSQNDGLQPWYSNRENFGLQKIKSQQLFETEEGLATINSLIQASSKYLWTPALLYYAACKATAMTFEELFNHLGHFLENREQRWRYVMRIKRSLPDPAGVGGYGNDQGYFKGAVEILRNMDHINFRLLYAGKICFESLPRIQRTARLECIRLPHFLLDIEAYHRTLNTIAAVNGITKNKTGLPRTVGSKVKLRKAKNRKTSSKKRKKTPPDTHKVKGHEHDATEESMSTDDEMNNNNSQNGLHDDDCDDVCFDDVIFNRTYDDYDGSSSPSFKFNGNQLNQISLSPLSSFAIDGDYGGTQSPYEETSQQNSSRYSLSSTYNHTDNETSKKSRLGSPVHANHDRIINIPTPPSLNPMSTKHKQANYAHSNSRGGYSDNYSSGRLSSSSTVNSSSKAPHRRSGNGPPSTPSSPGRQSSLQGGADRGGNGGHLGSGMPLLSMRYSREPSASPVPYSSHRWLLLKRDKCQPNSINST